MSGNSMEWKAMAYLVVEGMEQGLFSKSPISLKTYTSDCHSQCEIGFFNGK